MGPVYENVEEKNLFIHDRNYTIFIRFFLATYMWFAGIRDGYVSQYLLWQNMSVQHPFMCLRLPSAAHLLFMNMIWSYVFQDMSYHLPVVFGTDNRALVECFVGKQIMMNIYCVDKLLCLEHCCCFQVYFRAFQGCHNGVLNMMCLSCRCRLLIHKQWIPFN